LKTIKRLAKGIKIVGFINAPFDANELPFVLIGCP
jgi:hypothetical protein